jgi:hypothetical protein
VLPSWQTGACLPLSQVAMAAVGTMFATAGVILLLWLFTKIVLL